MPTDAISLDAIAAHPELAKTLTATVRRELAWRLKIAAAALEADYDQLPDNLTGRTVRPPPENKAKEPTDDDLLDYEGAAHFMERSVNWVRNHPTECGGIKVGRMWRFPRWRLRAVLQAKINASLKR